MTQLVYGHEDTGRTVVKQTLNTSKSGLDKPDFFLGGCGSANAPRKTKMRASWVQPKDEEMSLASLMLKPTNKPVDFMGGSSSKGLDVNKANNTPMSDDTEKTADLSYSELEVDSAPEAEKDDKENKSTSSMAYAIDEFLPGSEPTPIKKWTPPKKEKESAAPEAKHMASAYAQTDFLPGCEPAPIRRWTPPPKETESAAHKANHMASAYAQVDFLPGCEPVPIRRWTPPPKEDKEVPAKRASATWDQPTQFLGGCEPKQTRRWSKPSV